MRSPLLRLWPCLLVWCCVAPALVGADPDPSPTPPARHPPNGGFRAREQMRTLPADATPPGRPVAKPTPAPAAPVEATPPGEPVAAPTPAPPAGTAPAPGSPTGSPNSPALAGSPPSAGEGTQPPVIVVEKSGRQENEPEVVPPPPPPPKRGFWARLFGLGASEEAGYRYLNRRVLEAIRRAPVRGGRWKYIVVHNSGTRQGNARIFDYYHRHVRRMPNGLAYHFVIGNGTSTGDGQIEIGERWRRQINGGHVHSDYLNNIALGICLVGDFNRQRPTRAQYAALQELILYLRKRVGRVDRRLAIIKAHREINPVPTDCPGELFNYGWLHHEFD